jgi:hypothetical protein
MRINSGLLFWGAALITAGALALAVQANLVPREAFADAWSLWPLILVAIGVGLLLSRSPLAWVGALVGGVVLGILGGALLTVGPSVGACSGDPQESHSAGGTLSQGAEVDVDFNCGALEITAAAGTAWELMARGDEPRAEEEEGRLEVRTRDGAPFGVGRSRNEWSLTLPSDPTLDLNVSLNAGNGELGLAGLSATELSLDVNAGDATLDLQGASADELDVGVNAGSTTVIVDEASQLAGTLEANAGSLIVCAAERTDLAITIEDAVAFSHNLDESGLTRSGETWRSGSGTATVTLRIEGNAASFALDPEEGC